MPSNLRIVHCAGQTPFQYKLFDEDYERTKAKLREWWEKLKSQGKDCPDKEDTEYETCIGPNGEMYIGPKHATPSGMTTQRKLNRELDATMLMAIVIGLALWGFSIYLFPGAPTPGEAQALSQRDVEGITMCARIELL